MSSSSFSIQRAMLEIPQQYVEGVRKNIEDVRVKLEEYKLDLRDDSRLAFSYATNTLYPAWSLDEIVYELCLMHFLYNYTNYPKICRTFLTQMKQSFVHDFPIHISYEQLDDIANRHIQQYGIPMCKIMAIRELENGLPEQWPWIAESKHVCLFSDDNETWAAVASRQYRKRRKHDKRRKRRKK